MQELEKKIKEIVEKYAELVAKRLISALNEQDVYSGIQRLNNVVGAMGSIDHLNRGNGMPCKHNEEQSNDKEPEQLIKDKKISELTYEEFVKIKDFEKNGNKHLEDSEMNGITIQTQPFALSIQLLHILAGEADFTKPFRTVIDYYPDQERVVIKTYKAK